MILLTDSPIRYWSQDKTGPPEFPSHPCKHMSFSQTPAVSQALALAHLRLLHSGTSKPSAFPSVDGYSSATLQYFRAQQTTYALDPPLLRTPCYQDRTWASLLTCWLSFSLVGLGNREVIFRTHWVTLINFRIIKFFPRLRIYLGTSL